MQAYMVRTGHARSFHETLCGGILSTLRSIQGRVPDWLLIYKLMQNVHARCWGFQINIRVSSAATIPSLYRFFHSSQCLSEFATSSPANLSTSKPSTLKPVNFHTSVPNLVEIDWGAGLQLAGEEEHATRLNDG